MDRAAHHNTGETDLFCYTRRAIARYLYESSHPALHSLYSFTIDRSNHTDHTGIGLQAASLMWLQHSHTEIVGLAAGFLYRFESSVPSISKSPQTPVLIEVRKHLSLQWDELADSLAVREG